MLMDEYPGYVDNAFDDLLHESNNTSTSVPHLFIPSIHNFFQLGVYTALVGWPLAPHHSRMYS
jgi:hypothetical protein